MPVCFRRFAPIVALMLGALFPAARSAHAATFTVINGNNSGVGSLNEAITFANANPNTDLINF